MNNALVEQLGDDSDGVYSLLPHGAGVCHCIKLNVLECRADILRTNFIVFAYSFCLFFLNLLLITCNFRWNS